MIPTNQQVIEQYLADREKIRKIRAKADELVAGIEQFQANREAHLLKQDDPEIIEFMTDLYLNGRDGKAAAEAKKKDLGLKQGEIESWLLKLLDKLKSKGMKTQFGTVYPTRKESVSVEDWDQVVEFAILRPEAEAVADFIADFTGNEPLLERENAVNQILTILRDSARIEFINKAVNKTSILEVMGDKDEKNDSRPNPPPPGVKYTAIRTVGVRKS